MGALPKNKITRAERGKRRAGNTPDLKQDVKTTKTPLAKKSLTNSMMASMGYEKATITTESHKSKKAKNASTRLDTMPQNQAVTGSVSAGDKNKHRAQHKG